VATGRRPRRAARSDGDRRCQWRRRQSRFRLGIAGNTGWTHPHQTLILLTGGHAVSAALYKRLKFDPIDGFAWCTSFSNGMGELGHDVLLPKLISHKRLPGLGPIEIKSDHLSSCRSSKVLRQQSLERDFRNGLLPVALQRVIQPAKLL
jgi:hypothetical protein